MGRIDGNQPSQLNSLDDLFKIKGSDDKTPDQMAINTGLLKKFGKDEAVTYLLTHIKDDQEVHITRDIHGHLTWTIGDQDLNIGSSWWECLKHKFKMAFSNDYKLNLGAELEPKIDKIEKAYLRCIANEIDADVNIKEANAADLEVQRKAQEKQDADVFAQAEQVRLDHEQKAEQVRLANEQKAEQARRFNEANEKIPGLKNKIKTGEEEFNELTENFVATNNEFAVQTEVLNQLLTFQRNFPADSRLQSEALKSDVEKFNETVGIYGSVFFITDAERETIAKHESTLGSLATEELQKAKKKEFAAREKQLREQGQKFNGIDQEIALQKEVIKSLKSTVDHITAQLKDKETTLKTLRDELQEEEDIIADAEEAAAVVDPIQEAVPELKPVEIPVVVPEPELTADQKAKLARAEALAAALDNGLSDDEAAFYADLEPIDRVHYDWIRKPADGATKCSTIADFLLTLIKGRNAKRVGSTIQLDPGEVKMQLGGEDAKITLPSNFKMSYDVDKQAWTLDGKGLRMVISGYDVSLDGSQFEIRKHDFNIKLKSSAQSFGVKIAMGLAYPNGIEVPYDVVLEDVFHSNSKVV